MASIIAVTSITAGTKARLFPLTDTADTVRKYFGVYPGGVLRDRDGNAVEKLNSNGPFILDIDISCIPPHLRPVPEDPQSGKKRGKLPYPQAISPQTLPIPGSPDGTTKRRRGRPKKNFAKKIDDSSEEELEDEMEYLDSTSILPHKRERPTRTTTVPAKLADSLTKPPPSSSKNSPMKNDILGKRKRGRPRKLSPESENPDLSPEREIPEFENSNGNLKNESGILSDGSSAGKRRRGRPRKSDGDISTSLKKEENQDSVTVADIVSEENGQVPPSLPPEILPSGNEIPLPSAVSLGSDEMPVGGGDEADITVLCEVEKILSSRIVGDKKEYYIKWQGFPETENTWEPVHHLSSQLVDEYEEGQAQQLGEGIQLVIHETLPMTEGQATHPTEY